MAAQTLTRPRSPAIKRHTGTRYTSPGPGGQSHEQAHLGRSRPQLMPRGAAEPAPC